VDYAIYLSVRNKKFKKFDRPMITASGSVCTTDSNSKMQNLPTIDTNRIFQEKAESARVVALCEIIEPLASRIVGLPKTS
jgi:hypothetical protein